MVKLIGCNKCQYFKYINEKWNYCRRTGRIIDKSYIGCFIGDMDNEVIE